MSLVEGHRSSEEGHRFWEEGHMSLEVHRFQEAVGICSYLHIHPENQNFNPILCSVLYNTYSIILSILFSMLFIFIFI